MPNFYSIHLSQNASSDAVLTGQDSDVRELYKFNPLASPSYRTTSEADDKATETYQRCSSVTLPGDDDVLVWNYVFIVRLPGNHIPSQPLNAILPMLHRIILKLCFTNQVLLLPSLLPLIS
jgi:hypothetical protein